ncbi:hypothetical protein ASPCADRAFT_125359 [Aspergillus carbonarius ITEM 5010]|uniref:Uncharacterized protein n=1 Tax=Aspergillus carbonarius (strain ITEM 5010) TaxID=602072 RepID=A0A1R3S0T0_ASPC5|nr:hypothetical protein ASPCADRAFT_125359 [Aspergillus carbonarius ITEM 5010]
MHMFVSLPLKKPLEMQHICSEDKVRRIHEQVNNLDKEKLSEIVIKAAEKHPGIHAMLENTIETIHRREYNRLINFDWKSKCVWKDLNITYQHLSRSKQYDVASELEEDIIAAIERITSQCGSYANPQTRLNGLSVLRKSGKSIVLSYGQVAYEVRDRFQWDHIMEDSMIKIVNAMEIEERADIYWDISMPDTLGLKLLELCKLAKGYCVFEQLPNVLDLLQGDEDPEGWAEWEDDEDEDVTYN